MFQRKLVLLVDVLFATLLSFKEVEKHLQVFEFVLGLLKSVGPLFQFTGLFQDFFGLFGVIPKTGSFALRLKLLNLVYFVVNVKGTSLRLQAFYRAL